jgi:hypothetical protein
VSTIAVVYWDHAAAAFNRWGVLLQVILVIFCLGGSALPWQLSILLGADLIALTLRDAWTHHDVFSNGRPRAWYYLDSVTDVIVVLVFVMASQAVASAASSRLALPPGNLFRGAVVCLPLMAILRAVFRRKPEAWYSLAQETNITSGRIFWRTWRLNLLWLVSFYGLVAQNVTDKPDYLPDNIRGLVMALLGIWFVVQTDNLLGRSTILTIFTSVRRMTLERMHRYLPRGLRKGDPLYRGYIILEIAIYLVMGMSLGEALWPWLSGQSTHVDVFRVAGSILAFATSILSWEWVKESNRAAARVIEAEIQQLPDSLAHSKRTAATH